MELNPWSQNSLFLMGEAHSDEELLPLSAVQTCSLTSVSRSCGEQSRHSHKVVCCASKQSLQLCPCSAAEPTFSHAPNCLEPSEDFFDFLSDPLTHSITFMASSPAVNRRAASSVGIGRYVRGDFLSSHLFDKVFGIISFIGSDCFYGNLLPKLSSP